VTTLETAAAADVQEQARATFRQRQAAGQPLTGRALGSMFGRSERWGRDRIAEVRAADDGAAVVELPHRQTLELLESVEAADALPVEVERQPVAAAATAAADERQPEAAVERQPEAAVEPEGVPAKLAVKKSTWVFLVGAVVGLGVSVNTSWQYFDQKMGIHNVVERVTMFAGLEIVLLACGVSMFEAARDPRIKAGPARVLAWSLCGVSAFAALQLSGGLVGPMRVALGPVLALVALHRALGIEKHSTGTAGTGTLARVGREMRERLLSRLGLADDGRDAAARTKARAARKAAHLAHGGWAPFRTSRLNRALRTADVAHDEAQRRRMLAELAAIRHAGALRDLPMESPWKAGA
jgi:hypothetical protein